MRRKINIIAIWLATVVLTMAVHGQVASGGPYVLNQSVIANGGGQTTGGTFDLIGTIGQPVAGTGANGGTFVLQSGFWQRGQSPTAAVVWISGRVTTSAGNGLRNAAVEITDSKGQTRRAFTSAFGYYRFDDIPSGDTYVVSVISRRFQFAAQVISLKDALTGLDFVAVP